MLFTPFPLHAVDFLWLLSLRKRKLEISQKWKHGWFLHKRSICTSLGREAASEGQDCSYKGGLVLFWKGGSHFGLSLGAHLCVIRLSSETFFFPPTESTRFLILFWKTSLNKYAFVCDPFLSIFQVFSKGHLLLFFLLVFLFASVPDSLVFFLLLLCSLLLFFFSSLSLLLFLYQTSQLLVNSSFL